MPPGHPRNPESRLILIPGLGTNRLLFEPQRHHFDQALFLPDWIPPLQTRIAGRKPIPESIADYARRLAERWKETVLAKLETRRSYWLGGVSFGGMVALECARYLAEEKLPPKGVFLIASARSSDAVPAVLRLKLSLLDLIGPKFLPKLLPKLVVRTARREHLSELDSRLLSRIVAGANIEHLLWSARAIRAWRFKEADWKDLVRRGVRIHQIHGDGDWAIPLRKGDADTVIRGGKHLINMTHADQVNGYIASKMTDDAG